MGLCSFRVYSVRHIAEAGFDTIPPTPTKVQLSIPRLGLFNFETHLPARVLRVDMRPGNATIRAVERSLPSPVVHQVGGWYLLSLRENGAAALIGRSVRLGGRPWVGELRAFSFLDFNQSRPPWRPSADGMWLFTQRNFLHS